MVLYSVSPHSYKWGTEGITTEVISEPFPTFQLISLLSPEVNKEKYSSAENKIRGGLTRNRSYWSVNGSQLDSCVCCRWQVEEGGDMPQLPPA